MIALIALAILMVMVDTISIVMMVVIILTPVAATTMIVLDMIIITMVVDTTTVMMAVENNIITFSFSPSLPCFHSSCPSSFLLSHQFFFGLSSLNCFTRYWYMTDGEGLSPHISFPFTGVW